MGRESMAQFGGEVVVGGGFVPGAACGRDGAGGPRPVGGALHNVAAPLVALFCGGRGDIGDDCAVWQGFVCRACERAGPFAQWRAAGAARGGGSPEGSSPGSGVVRGKDVPLSGDYSGEASALPQVQGDWSPAG